MAYDTLNMKNATYLRYDGEWEKLKFKNQANQVELDPSARTRMGGILGSSSTLSSFISALDDNFGTSNGFATLDADGYLHVSQLNDKILSGMYPLGVVSSGKSIQTIVSDHFGTIDVESIMNYVRVGDTTVTITDDSVAADEEDHIILEPGDEGDVTFPITLESGDWLILSKYVAPEDDSYTYEGEWASEESYLSNNVVLYNDVYYLCILDISGTTTPDNDATHWTSKGEYNPAHDTYEWSIINNTHSNATTGAVGLVKLSDSSTYTDFSSSGDDNAVITEGILKNIDGEYLKDADFSSESSGFLKKDSGGSYSVDTNAYLRSDTDTSMWDGYDFTINKFSDGANQPSSNLNFKTTDSMENATTHSMNVDANGILFWKSNKVWHAGNDGDGSNLDADKLDGYEATAFLGANEQATDSDQLDGKDATDFLRSNETDGFTGDELLIDGTLLISAVGEAIGDDSNNLNFRAVDGSGESFTKTMKMQSNGKIYFKAHEMIDEDNWTDYITKMTTGTGTPPTTASVGDVYIQYSS